MIKAVLLFILWLLSLSYFFDSFNESKELCENVGKMIHLIKIGVCEKRLTLNEIMDSNEFTIHNPEELKELLWEKHELLGIDQDMIEMFQAFIAESRFENIKTCSETIVNVERCFLNKLNENQINLKAKMVTVSTICTAFFSIIFVITV